MYFWPPLISVVVGIILINSAILTSARAWRTKWLADIPLEIRYVITLSLYLLVLLNANQWLPGKIVFPAMVVLIIAIIIKSFGKLNASERNDVWREAKSIIVVQVVALTFIVIAFHSNQYFVLEAANNDSIIYFYGRQWAHDSRLFVPDKVVLDRWWIPTSIGYGGELYRGGTYTLLSWANYFSPYATGSSTYYIFAYVATLIWFIIRLVTNSVFEGGAPYKASLITLVTLFSVGIIGALVNSNLATILGATSLLMIFALALRSGASIIVRYGLMAVWCAISAQFYGEAMFYAGVLILGVYLSELAKNIRVANFKKMAYLAVGMVCAVLFLGNIAVIRALYFIVIFSGMPKVAGWFHWYLTQPKFVWIGAFNSGLLMGGELPVSAIVIASVIITIYSTLSLLYFRISRVAVLSLIFLTVISVAYLTISSYQYGEHKILQLLGPSWALVVILASVLVLNFKTPIKNEIKAPLIVAKVVASGALFGLIVLIVSFSLNSITLLNRQRGLHSLAFGLADAESYIKKNETVLIDDANWIGIEKFFKSHYIASMLRGQGAAIVMPSVASDELRGGYLRNFMNDKFKNSEGVDWLVKGKGYAVPVDKILPNFDSPAWENSDYRLYRVDKKPVVVSGNGWYDCEPTLCWTTAPFELETYVPQNETYELAIDFAILPPPDNWRITVREIGGGVLKVIDRADDGITRLKLPTGWNRLTFEANWPILSPAEKGISQDSRRLFAAIRRIELVRIDQKNR